MDEEVRGSNEPILHNTNSSIHASGSQSEIQVAKMKLVRTRIERSAVWEHFKKVKNSDGETNAICNYCGKSYKHVGSHGTNTQWNHVRNKCKKSPLLEKRSQSSGQQTLSFQPFGKHGECNLVAWKYDADLVREAFTRMIIVDELPFNFGEHEGFNYFMSVAQPKFKSISRTTVARDIMKIYACEKIKLKNILKQVEGRICFTTDMWTSIQNISYLCLTAHFIDHEWKLHKRIINFCTMSSHKGKEIGKMIETCIGEWEIEKVGTITLDNASVNDVAINYLKSKWGKRSEMMFNGKYLQIRCCAHILNLIVKDGIGEMQSSVSRIRTAIKYIRSSPARTAQFKKCIEQEKIPFNSSVCLDVPTRWNSTYVMLETALKFQKAFERMEEEDLQFLCELDMSPPSEEDWKHAQVLTKFLKHFFEATKRLSGNLYVTSNIYFHEIFKIESILIEWSNSNDSNLQGMAKKMKEKFDKYWGSSEKVNMLFIAVLLDPRYKLKYIKFCLSCVHGKEHSLQLVAKLMNCMDDLYEHYNILYPVSQLSKNEGNAMDRGAMTIDKNEDDVTYKWKNAFKKHLLEEENEERKTELDRYFEEPCESDDEDFSILDWWKVNRNKYRVLSCIARDVLTIPVSTVSSESTFSMGGRILDQFRSSLTPKIVECVICSEDWLRSSSIKDVEEKLEDLDELEVTGMMEI